MTTTPPRQPEPWLPETVSFTELERILIERRISKTCEVCRQSDVGFTLLAASAEGSCTEVHINMQAFFVVICRHCGHTRFHHKRTLFAAVNGTLEADQ